jgi:hypothetical protein
MDMLGINPVRLPRKCITVHANGDFTQGKGEASRHRLSHGCEPQKPFMP